MISIWPKESPYTYYWSSDTDDAGRFVAFTSSVRDGSSGVYVRDMRSRTIVRVDVPKRRGRPRNGPPVDDRRFGKGAAGVAISGDGRYVVFSHGFESVVNGDRNGKRDIFRFDRKTGKTELVSTSATGEQSDGDSEYASISRDGRYVAFTSRAENLGDRTHRTEVYVKDMETGGVVLPSPGSGAYRRYDAYSPAISDDGGRVVFVTTAEDIVLDDRNRAADAFLTDVAAGETSLISLTSDDARIDPLEYSESAGDYRDGVDEVTISGDGRIVAFSSHANGIVEEDDNNNVDIFVRDLTEGTTERVSVTSSGADAYTSEDRECGLNGQCFGFIASRRPLLSRDGRYVAFMSGSSVLEPPGFDDPNGGSDDVFVRDRTDGLTLLVNRDHRGRPTKSSNLYLGSLSPDGSFVTYAADGRVLAKRHGRGENGDLYLQRLSVPFDAGER